MGGISFRKLWKRFRMSARIPYVLAVFAAGGLAWAYNECQYQQTCPHPYMSDCQNGTGGGADTSWYCCATLRPCGFIFWRSQVYFMEGKWYYEGGGPVKCFDRISLSYSPSDCCC